MKFTKLTQKLKTSALSIFVAIAMLLSANFSSFYSMANFARYTASVANAVYSAKKDHSFDFGTSESLTTSVSGNSANYDIDRDASLIDAFAHVSNQKYFPIVKYNGFSALSETRKELTADQLKADSADNYYGVISTNNYQVARKDYKKDDDNNFIYETVKLTTVNNEGTADEETVTENVNIIYVSANKKSGESDDQYAERMTALKTVISEMNSEKNTSNGNLYVYLNTNSKENVSYDSSDYTMVNTDSDWYKQIGEDLEGKQINDEDIVQSDYRFYNKKTFEYVENSLAIKTNGTITFTNNNYYVVSVWVYTAGPDTTATIAVTGTNLEAKIENISTNGLWVQYYLFIEAPAAQSPSVTISLYYGDDNGVTGLRTLQSYQNGNLEGTEEADYKTKTLTGTVAFDQLRVDAINQEEFVNQTINGYSYSDIAKASLSSSCSIDGANDTTKIQNNNNAIATTTGEGSDKTTTYTYSYVSYSSIEQLSSSATYSARHFNPSVTDFDSTFQQYKDNTNSSLIYNYNNATNLDYDTYLANGVNNMFTYYMPRYTSDDNTTTLTSLAKQAYRDRYQNSNVSYTDEEIAKYGTSQLWATVVAEETEFEAYEKDKVDEFGNNVEVENEEGNKETDKLKDLHNNTFITTPNEINYILKLENKSSYELGLTSTAIYMPANAYYRVSVWAYSSDNEAVATAKLFSTLTQRSSEQLGTLALASANVTDFEYNGNSTNGWQEIVFTVQGNPYQDCNLYLSLLASANDTVYFDQIKVENITSSQYTNGTNRLNLADKAVLTSKVTNGLFNNITVDSTDPIKSYPYTASSWTIDSKESSDSVISGVVNTNETVFKTQIVPAYNDEGELDYYDQNYITYKADGYHYEKDGTDIALTYGVNYLVDYKGDFVRATTLDKMFDTDQIPVTTINDILQAEGLPGYSDAENTKLPDSNVYAVYLPTPTDTEADNPSFLMKSSSISSLNSASVYKLTFQVWIAENFEGNIVANLVYDSKNITDIELDTTKQTVNRNTWQTFTIYIRTGNTSRSGISLQLGATESTGTIFFQNVNYTTLAEKTESGKTITVDEQFDSLLNKYPTIDSQNYVNNGKVECLRFVDMQSNNFTMHSTKQDEETYLYTSYGYTLPTKASTDEFTQGTVAVVNTDSSQAFKFDGQGVNIAKNLNTQVNTALLLKNEETTDYTVANSLFSTTLSSNKYYKVTFYVKTNDMGENGLKVTANGLNENFTNINTTGTADNNGWEQYTIYVAVGSSSISTFSLSFTLGTSDQESFTGWALLSNMTLTELEEDEFTTDTEKEEVKNSDNVIIKSLKSTDDSDDDTSKEGDENEFQWTTFFLVFSSVLLVIALAIALVSVIVKKKAKKNNPDAAANGGIEATETQDNGGIE